MQQTILLGPNNKFSIKANKWGQIFLGSMFLLIGVSNIVSNHIQPLGAIIGALIVVGGGVQIVYSLLAYSTASKYAPKVKLTEGQIEWKSSFFHSPTVLKWSGIRKVDLGSYIIVFYLGDKETTFSYQTAPSTSVEVKEAIREIAESKNIEVIN